MSRTKPIRERKRWVAVSNIYLEDPATLVEGLWLDHNDRTLWHTDHNIELLPKTIVGSGAIFETAFSPRQERGLIVNGHAHLAEKAETLNFALEEYFGEGGAAILRANDIYTLEDIAVEKEALVPMTELNKAGETYLPLRDLLATLCNNDQQQIEEWIQTAQRVVGMNPQALQPASPTPAPQEAEPKKDAPLAGGEES